MNIKDRNKEIKYDVAISFAGEQREYAEQIALGLRRCGVSVFLDAWEAGDLWGKDLVARFYNLFSREALFAVTVFSKEYNEKYWTKFEFESMQGRQYLESEYVLPITFDGSFPENWPSTRGFIRASNYTTDEIVVMIREKIKGSEKNSLIKKTSDIVELPEKKMTIISEDGSTEVVKVILAFEFKDTSREFVVYSKDEYDSRGNVTVFVSHVDRSEGNPKLVGVTDESEWIRIKEVLWELSRSQNDRECITCSSVPLFDKDGVEIL